MSVQDDINYVKKELSSDERVLESALKIETLYRKYKFIVWSVVIVLILFFVGSRVMDAIQESKLEKANQAFLTLQTNSEDAQALLVLKENNPLLSELFAYSQATKKKDIKMLETLGSSSNDIIADASRYTVGVLNRKPVDSKLYKELALFEEAYLSIQSGDTKKAKAKLELIDERSSLGMLTELFNHSMIKVK